MKRTLANAKIEVILSEKKLYLYQNDRIINTYSVAVGAPQSPTPVGTFKVVEKAFNPGGVFGTRWMTIIWRPKGKIGIHGTNNPSSIGKAASKGCIRMYNRDVEDLFTKTPIGTPVIVKP